MQGEIGEVSETLLKKERICRSAPAGSVGLIIFKEEGKGVPMYRGKRRRK